MAVYKLSDLKVIVGFIPLIGGHADDSEVVSIEPVDPTVTMQQGASGDVVFSVTGKVAVRVGIKLLQTSGNNALLSAAHIAQMANGPSPLMIQIGTTALISSESMIEGFPKMGFGAEAGMYEWFMGASVDAQFVGGT
jgi:hypothetical protein